jgi:hypothetical protein
MATNVTAAFNLTYKQTRTITGLNVSVPTDQGIFTFPNITFSNGTAAGSLSECYHGTLTLVGTASQELDLAGSLVMQGSTITFTKVKTLWVYNKGTNLTDIVTVGGAASNAWESWVTAAGDSIKIEPGACWGFCVGATSTGYTVTAGTGDKLKFVNASTNTVTVDLMIGGNAT